MTTGIHWEQGDSRTGWPSRFTNLGGRTGDQLSGSMQRQGGQGSHGRNFRGHLGVTGLKPGPPCWPLVTLQHRSSDSTQGQQLFQGLGTGDRAVAQQELTHRLPEETGLPNPEDNP